MIHEPVLINRRPIDPGDLQVFTNAWDGDPNLPAFLESWYDPKDYFPALTSGSTGKPTTVRLLKKYALASADATIRFLGLKPGSSALLSMPAGYIAGRMMIVRAITGGLNLIPIPPASNPEIPDQIIDLAAFTPHQFQNILTSDKNSNYKKIRNILLGGAPVPDELIRRLNGFSGRIYETFGMTETYSHIALRMRYPDKEDYFQAMDQVSFTNPEDRLVIQAPHLGIPYLQTNDIVETDGPFRFRWLGRSDFVINTGGIKIHPETIEKKLTGLIGSPFFITGQSDDQYGEKVVLIIQKIKSDQGEIELNALMEKTLDRYEKPKSIMWVDKLIYTATGKINRIETKKYYNL